MPSPPSLRLLTVDAAALSDRHAVARLIAEHRPDIACVHGAPSLLRWRSTCAALAREAGMVVVVGGRTSGGNLLLSTLGVDVEGVHELTFTGRPGVRRPGAALAALRLRGSAFRFAGAQLTGAPGDRARQGGELQAALDALTPDRPPVLLSVTGAESDGAVLATLVPGATALPGGVFAAPGIDVIDTTGTTGGVRADLTLPS